MKPGYARAQPFASGTPLPAIGAAYSYRGGSGTEAGRRHRNERQGEAFGSVIPRALHQMSPPPPGTSRSSPIGNSLGGDF